MNRKVRASLVVILLTVCGVAGYNIWLVETSPEELAYSSFIRELGEDRFTTVSLLGNEMRIVDLNGKEFATHAPDLEALLPLLLNSAVTVISRAPPSDFDRLRSMILLAMVMMVLWFSIAYGGRGQSKRFNKNRSQRGNKADIRSFDDVAGIDEVSEELVELVDFLKNHDKYNLLGGRIPKGVLLQGPPGTGKTLLARALAGEASVPFYSIGGSDFIEMFAGVGASRVRELFAVAKKSAPCIVFIDEIDAIGGRRSNGSSGSHEEREQTLNALLVEMDGFSSHETIIVIGATNRPDVLDPALLRPGRFDRQLTVSLPSLKGRIKILEVHIRAITIAANIDLHLIAKGIPGFSGADIANLVNEAALIAARNKKKAVDSLDFEEAKDKIMMGLERKNAAINDHERRIIAFHESGHAIVARLLPETDQLHKVTIIPRGMALGLTQQVPLEERYTYSLVYLLNKIKVLLGGRIAEKIVFDQLSTGAANDFAAVTEIASRIVCEWGMSHKMGVRVYRRHSQNYLGQHTDMSQISETTCREIDLEIRRIIEQCYSQTEELLCYHSRLIHELAEVLLINETIDAEELDIIVQCYLDKRQGTAWTEPMEKSQ
jgi:cell division protease FtsH